MAPQFDNFDEFFPYYLAEHANPVCRGLHYTGTTLATALLLYAVFSQIWWLLILYPVVGYGFAWAGHFVFEKNRPATFDYWRWSLMGDYKMYVLWVTGRLPAVMEDSRLKYGASAKGAEKG